MCQQGDCKGSICLKYGMEQCFLSSKDKSVRYNTRDLCELACQVKKTELRSHTLNRRRYAIVISGAWQEWNLPKYFQVGRKWRGTYLSLMSCKLNFYFSHLFHLIFLLQAANRNLTKGLSLRAGAPCDNFQGYCDVFLKCRQVELKSACAICLVVYVP